MIQKRIIAFAVIMVIAGCMAAFAETEDIAPFSSGLISHCSIGIGCCDGNTVIVSVGIVATHTQDKIGLSGLRIESFNGVSWETVQTYPAMYNQDSLSYFNVVRWPGEAGKVYRTVCAFQAATGKINEYQIKTGMEIELPRFFE